VTQARQQGFTLIEMVIAFAILGVALTALYGTFESTLLRSRHDAHLGEAVHLAQSLLARAGYDWAQDEQTLTGGWEGFSYEIVQRPMLPPRGQVPYTVRTVLITASVSWPEAAGTRTFALSTLKFLPHETH
jgi:general secretion pathway protein I